MADALTIAAFSMQEDTRRIAQVAQNISNVGTIGYKGGIALGRPFDDYSAQVQQAVFGAPAPGTDVARDASPATLRATSQWSDLAIEGEGFFEVTGPQGPLYTRRGDFRIDGTGRLVTHDGLPVASTNGDIVLSGKAVSINAEGKVFEGENYVAQIKTVKIEHPESVSIDERGYFHIESGANVSEASVRVRQGFLENANIDMGREMVRLMESARHFETTQRIIQNYDEALGKALSRFAEL